MRDLKARMTCMARTADQSAPLEGRPQLGRHAEQYKAPRGVRVPGRFSFAAPAFLPGPPHRRRHILEYASLLLRLINSPAMATKDSDPARVNEEEAGT